MEERRARRAERTTRSRDLATLRWISEQYAVRLDQLAALLAVSPSAARRTATRMARAGLVDRRRFLVDEPPWLWLTAAGERLGGGAFGPWRPRVGALAHLAAVNDTRLHIAASAPGAQWVCERTLARENRGHLPDAVVLIDGERHAIEVELTAKSTRRLDGVIGELSDRFDRVVYFTTPAVRARLRAIDAGACYPKLVVRDLPCRTEARA